MYSSRSIHKQVRKTTWKQICRSSFIYQLLQTWPLTWGTYHHLLISLCHVLEGSNRTYKLILLARNPFPFCHMLPFCCSCQAQHNNPSVNLQTVEWKGLSLTISVCWRSTVRLFEFQFLCYRSRRSDKSRNRDQVLLGLGWSSLRDWSTRILQATHWEVWVWQGVATQVAIERLFCPGGVRYTAWCVYLFWGCVQWCLCYWRCEKKSQSQFIFS